ncbi:MAG: hypothetical protein HRT61_02735 [Ekhidna sp.]|nr:hypothetical protein [Ekhidna sp.]
MEITINVKKENLIPFERTNLFGEFMWQLSKMKKISLWWDLLRHQSAFLKFWEVKT